MKILVPGLVVFVIWCVISVRWYVCGIHELCDDARVSNSEVEEKPRIPVEDVLEEPYQAPLAFEWSSADPLTNAEYTNYLDSLKSVFDMDPAAVVEITGLYDRQELNNSEYDNLGLARAENTKQLLLNSGIKRSMRVISGTDDLSSGLRGNINRGVLFKLVPQEVKTGYIITEAKNKLVIHYPNKNVHPKSNPQVQGALNKLAAIAIKNEKKILVVGHTDNHGESLDNSKLGLANASLVKEMLISYGMSEQNVLAESEGEEMPIVSNATRRGRQQNRRIEISII